MRILVDARKTQGALPDHAELLVTEAVDTHPYLKLKDDQLYSSEDQLCGRLITVDTPEVMQAVMEVEFSDDEQYLLLQTGEWQIIPVENLIAKLHDLNMELFCFAYSLDDVKLLADVLELGVDGVVVPPELFAETQELQSSGIQYTLDELEVVALKKVGTGDRVCIDTTATLRSGEGMLIGSTSSVFALIEAEVKESGYVRARPFRVNAGPVSSYILNREKTNYLSELEAGFKVQIVDRTGSTREELVGRVKIERRPLLLVTLKFEEQTYPLMVQDAETVRLMTPSGSTGVNELSVGDVVLGKVEKRGRHFGMAVDEYIEER